MRIHTNLNESQMSDALANMPNVSFARLNVYGSRSHDRAFDVILSGNSGRKGMHGSYGDPDAATYDEWGIFLNNVFKADPEAKTSNYKDAEDFAYKTGGRYATLDWSDQHKRHKWENPGTGYENVCACGAITRWK